ncbi:uncharacterized protein LOC123655661 [Melitaea cinxia]|uniref:uncharacterized protein LOC123655661 n=1 Tax=Melitaea cinxia TaxID=113334 RepID=UPI001E273A3A|nr:uncharacterized protein LOC123655661 [Melitaea cinxia]
MALWPIKFDDFFKISTISMRFNGSHPFVTVRNKLWLFKIYVSRILGSICFLFLVNSIISHDVKNGKFTEAVKNGTMAIVAVTVTFKHSILVHRRASIKELINFISKDYQVAEDFGNEGKEIVLKYAKKGIQICRFWLIAGGLTCFIFPIEAFVLMSYHCVKKECQLIPMFDLTYPKGIDEYKDIFIVYCATFLLCFSFALYSTSVYIGFDPLVPIFMLHTCGQLDLISTKLRKALREASNVQERKENLKRINIRLTEIYRFVKKAQNIFVILYEFNLKTTTFLIPFSGYQIVEALRHKEIPLDFTFFFIASMLHLYSPCYYSDLLMEKSESLRQAIYACGWELYPDVEIRKTILLMLTRTSTPLVIKTVFYPICLNTFAEMCRQAYAIYNIMNAAW